eukprot:10443328-Ditylum_brightwellii.AAC.1
MVINCIRKEIFKQNINLICRLCYRENKTIWHIVSRYKLLAGTKYTEHHNKVRQYLHWCIMQDNNVPVNTNWKKHKLKPVMLITNQLSVTYGMTQEMEGTVEENCPDIVILDEKEKKALNIGITVPTDINMIKAATVSPKKGIYNPDCSRCPRYDMSELVRPACTNVTKS